MDDRPIGIMDSGSGGLSIYRSLRKALPHERFIYIGDHAYVPYGEKTHQFILDRAHSIIRTLLTMQVKCVIIACNTSTVVGINEYKKFFPEIPIIGVVPILKTAAKLTKTKSIAVISTPVTAKSIYLRDLIRKFASGIRVLAIGNSRLVAAIESGTLSSKRIIRKEIQAMKKEIESKHIDVIVLGCTHFPLVRKEFEQVFGNGVAIIDSGQAVARQVERVCAHNQILSARKGNEDTFFTTGDPRRVSRLFSSLLTRPIVVRSLTNALE